MQDSHAGQPVGKPTYTAAEAARPAASRLICAAFMPWPRKARYTSLRVRYGGRCMGGRPTGAVV